MNMKTQYVVPMLYPKRKWPRKSLIYKAVQFVVALPSGLEPETL